MIKKISYLFLHNSIIESEISIQIGFNQFSLNFTEYIHGQLHISSILSHFKLFKNNLKSFSIHFTVYH